MIGLIFVGQSQSKARQDEFDASQRNHMRRLHGRRDLSEQERAMLADIDRQVAEPQPRLSTRACVECGKPCRLVTVGTTTVDYCPACRGCWFDPGELSHLTRTGTDVPSQHVDHRPSRFACPVCGLKMWEHIFLKPHNLLVDRCPKGHGVYLEEGELKRALELT
jgi:Zn-finger nucleic acid-binding protein